MNKTRLLMWMEPLLSAVRELYASVPPQHRLFLTIVLLVALYALFQAVLALADRGWFPWA